MRIRTMLSIWAVTLLLPLPCLADFIVSPDLPPTSTGVQPAVSLAPGGP